MAVNVGLIAEQAFGYISPYFTYSLTLIIVVKALG